MIRIRDFVTTLLYQMNIEVRDENNYTLGVFPTDSDALKPYLEREVKQWFPCGSYKGIEVDFTVILQEEQEHE